jgi:hypothetical protein
MLAQNRTDPSHSGHHCTAATAQNYRGDTRCVDDTTRMHVR